jgi:hypothetical protein
LKKLKNGRRE